MTAKIPRSEAMSMTVVGQDDDKDYSESGYIIVVDLANDFAAIGNYSHCSCFGTWSSLCGGGVNDEGSGFVSFAWDGTVAELRRMVAERLDPSMPSRKASDEDYDHDHLVAAYDQAAAWFADENLRLAELVDARHVQLGEVRRVGKICRCGVENLTHRLTCGNCEPAAVN